MKRLFMAVTVLALTALSVAIYARRGGASADIGTDVVSRGSIVKVVSASGTLEAVETVQVGTQVSGSVQSLQADFNSIVGKGPGAGAARPVVDSGGHQSRGREPARRRSRSRAVQGDLG